MCNQKNFLSSFGAPQHSHPGLGPASDLYCFQGRALPPPPFQGQPGLEQIQNSAVGQRPPGAFTVTPRGQVRAVQRLRSQEPREGLGEGG